jgi:hypothetical protein
MIAAKGGYDINGTLVWLLRHVYKTNHTGFSLNYNSQNDQDRFGEQENYGNSRSTI